MAWGVVWCGDSWPMDMPWWPATAVLSGLTSGSKIFRPNSGSEWRSIPLDVTKEDQVNELARMLKDQGVHIAYLANNAGVNGSRRGLGPGVTDLGDRAPGQFVWHVLYDARV